MSHNGIFGRNLDFPNERNFEKLGLMPVPRTKMQYFVRLGRCQTANVLHETMHRISPQNRS